ncbi:SpoIIE family protein phosphatase [Streptomyces sp. NPDC051976]|uniref:ATP-binding SpoIIE family protein phosphatase n=1 Tax=Streptomyces sp. NPDC051976 TaxID=3154947 RepID=UPI00341CE020
MDPGPDPPGRLHPDHRDSAVGADALATGVVVPPELSRAAGVVLDAQGMVVGWSAAAERLLGLRAADVVGRPVASLLVDPVLPTPLPAPEEWSGPVTVRHADGGPRSLMVRVWPIDGSGATRGRVMVLGYDLSAARLALLSEVSERIGTTLDVWTTAQELADFAVPRLADMTVVDLFDDVLTGQEPPPVREDRPPTLRRAAQQSVRPGAPEALIRIGQVADYAPGYPVRLSLADGEPRLEADTDASATTWLPADPARAERARAFGFHSLMTVPIRARDTTLGVVTFLRRRPAEPFGGDDVGLARAVVDRAALSLDNARRFTRERATALALQRSLLPRRVRGTPVLDVASRYFPADGHVGVGGDWFDVIALSSARHALVVGDVVGHGTNAAATMGRLRSAVHALADMELPPDELLAHLDDLVLRFLDEETSGDPLTASALLGSTCLIAVLDPVAGQCTLARAGHPPPILITPGGRGQVLDVPAGPPLGLGALPFEAAQYDLPAGSDLVLYTDGLLPDNNPDDLLPLLHHRDPGSGVNGICDAVATGRHRTTARDDAALLVARSNAVPPGHIADWDLPTDPASVATIRQAVSDQLATWNLQELDFTTELIVSELVTNALRYGQPPLHLRLILHTALTCEVHDTSSTAPRLRHARTTDEGGRGLFLIAQLTTHWGTRHHPTGKTIWTEQQLPPTHP